MERFTYTVSHDLKSPSLRSAAFGLLEQDVLEGNAERMQTDITYIHMAAATMQRLLDELFELSRTSCGPSADRDTPQRLGARGSDTGWRADRRPRGTGPLCRTCPWSWETDRPRLLEVLQNLVDNAVKFMGTQPARGLRLDADRKRKKWSTMCRTTVEIDPRYHEKVFGLFEWLEPEGDVTGIGLALVKRIIEVHGGRIWAESAGQGCGSTFCFTLSTVGPL